MPNRPPRGQRRPPALPSSRERQAFRRALLGWYQRCARDLPWRRTRDPYRVLVSEVMLQQTQVDRVLPKYLEWLEKFPSLPALAAAPIDAAVATWYPLGYNIRPRRLHAIAREAVARYGGGLPADADELRAFDGIGDYTAGAIMSFAFGARAPILDTNVARLLFRVFVGRLDGFNGNGSLVGKRLSTTSALRGTAIRKHLWRLSDAVLPRQRVFDFNQALMDFGAMVCTARRPCCLACPLTALCRSFPGK